MSFADSGTGEKTDSTRYDKKYGSKKRFHDKDRHFSRRFNSDRSDSERSDSDRSGSYRSGQDNTGRHKPGRFSDRKPWDRQGDRSGRFQRDGRSEHRFAGRDRFHDRDHARQDREEGSSFERRRPERPYGHTPSSDRHDGGKYRDRFAGEGFKRDGDRRPDHFHDRERHPGSGDRRSDFAQQPDRENRFERKRDFDRPERRDRFEKRDGFERRDRGDRFEKRRDFDRSDRRDRFEKRDSFERRDRGDRFERKRGFDRPERRDGFERRDRGDRFEKRRDFDRPERRDGFEKRDGFERRDRGDRFEKRRDFDRPERRDRFEKRDGFERRGSFERRSSFDRRDHFDRRDSYDRAGHRDDHRDGYRDEYHSNEPARTSFDVLVLGAGASGLLCAAHLVSLGLSVALVDRSRTPGRKLSMAGGGHANFTNVNLDAGCYVSDTEGFVEPVLAKVGKDQLLHLMQVLRLSYEEKEKGKIFIKEEASDLVRALMRRCRKGDFAYFGGEALEDDCLVFDNDEVILRTRRNLNLTGRHAVLALGSPALPASGSSGIGYAMAQHIGHKVIMPEACLAPLFLEADSPLLGLQGISLPVKVGLCDRIIEDDLLFTHMGLSGPAILKASLYWEPGEVLAIDFLPGSGDELFAGAGAKTVLSAISQAMPDRLAERLVPDAALQKKRCAELSSDEKDTLYRALHQYLLLPDSMAGLRQAEVCRGGVDCREIEPVTFVSKLNSHVSIIGETLDVTGTLGGYNLHWAFASALLSAQAIADKLYPMRQRASESPDSRDKRQDRRPERSARRGFRR